MKLFYSYLVLICLLFQQCTSANKNAIIVQQDDEQFYTIDSFKTVEKIDAHVHVETADPAYLEQAKADNFAHVLQSQTEFHSIRVLNALGKAR